MTRSSFIHHHERMPRNGKSRILRGLFFCALGASLGLAQSAEDLRMTVGKSVVIDYPSDIRQISTSSPEILDASPVTTREILLHGKGLGSATMVVWSKTGQRTFYNVTVDLNLDPLRRLLKDSFPNEDIRVGTSRDAIVLDGHVTTKEVQDRALALAAAFSKVVVNNLQLPALPAEKQILLRVKFAELDRQKEVQYGVNLLAAPGNNPIGAGTGVNAPSFTGTAIVPNGAATVSSGAATSGSNSSGSTSSTSSGSNGTFTISQALNLFAFDPKLNIGAFIQALESESILQVLAQPNLVTTNGKEAEFLVGGQFPVPILQGGASAGAVTVQFKDFGIKLKFLPNITDHSTIKMHLTQEVSTLDPSHGVTLNGFNIPALSTRHADTDVELGEGQTFVVAGLLSDQDTYNLQKVPFLSSLPILGNLFKSKTDNKQKTELIMLVTPEITEPLGPNDPKPSLYFPKDFLKRLEQSDIPQSPKGKKSS